MTLHRPPAPHLQRMFAHLALSDRQYYNPVNWCVSVGACVRVCMRPP